MKKPSPQKSRLLGTYLMPTGQEVFGELRLRGLETTLRLHHHDFIHLTGEERVIHGSLHDLYKVSCIDCLVSPPGSGSRKDVGTYHFTKIFPHYVTIGTDHLQPNEQSIKAVHFSVDDIASVFYDFDAFGLAIDSKPLIGSVVAANKSSRTIPIGDSPQIAYFTGKLEVITADTAIGRISVNHRPRLSMGSPKGARIKNRMVISLEPESPATFETCIDGVLVLLRFLSLIAGRRQGIKSIQLELASKTSEPNVSLKLYWSYVPGDAKGKGDDSTLKPHPGDVPLNIIKRPQEFIAVLQDWIARDGLWRAARARYLSCLEKANYYDVDRLVAAANLFDILPKEAVPFSAELPEALASAQSACLAILKEQPCSISRDSAIDALKRMSRPSLPKKVLHRTMIVQHEFGTRFPELDLVAKTAIQCRNFFVHGGSSELNFEAVEPMVPFLTDALEFIFGTSDLIEAGWDASVWNGELHGYGHTFARFRGGYDENLARLKSALSRAS
jgi:hypothetical protein